MIKKLMISFCLLSITILQTAYAGSASSGQTSITCSPQLQKQLAKIKKIPEANKLIQRIQKEGSIYIVASSSPVAKQFGAFWDPDRRVISVNISKHRYEGELISSILFEMHNAAANSKIDRLDYLATTGQIDKESYVRGIEHIEYENSLSSAEIVDKGIRLSIFPPEAYLGTYDSFEEHFYYQKISGHSDHIAKNFDQLAPRYYGRFNYSR